MKQKQWTAATIALALVLIAGVVMTARYFSRDAQIRQEQAKLYHCPMHPQFTSDRPGDCPICGMKLVEAAPEEHAASAREAAATAPAEPAGQAKLYRCPMHPQITSGRPGDCPICGMKLVEVPPEEHAGHGGTKDGGRQSPEGYMPVQISPQQQAMMGILLADAQVMDLEKKMHTVARIVPDETRLHHIHTKFEGYIEELYVNFVGDHVKAGQVLFTVYSPELLVTQNEYLLALKARDDAAGQKGQSLVDLNLVDSALRRLKLWDIAPEEIAQLEKTRKPMKAVPVRSPVDGFVIAKNALQGMRITPNDVAYDVADLSALWALADVYEIDLPFVRAGEKAALTLPYQPGKIWQAAVSYVYPTVDEETRTIKVRLQIDNPDVALKPGMFGNVEITARIGNGLAVPESAVLTTGERKVLFVKQDDNVFDPREVVTGVKVPGFWEIKQGVRPGEKVVVGANFLLDSESKLRASISAMKSGKGHQH